MPDRKLVGLSEIADLANPPVSKQAVANWRHRFDDFPKPVETLQSGPVWDQEVIVDWLKARAGHAPVVISFINLKGGVAKTTTSVAVGMSRRLLKFSGGSVDGSYYATFSSAMTSPSC